MSTYLRAVAILFAIFLVAHSAYLHRVPGLMGDEASEGENVFEKLSILSSSEPRTDRSALVRGERSYIGPLIDYVRVPFIKTFGYSALALRAVVLAFSIATFWLAWVVLRRLFGGPSTSSGGSTPALFALVFFAFSPIYLTYQRLGWAITLFPFFALLTLFFLTSNLRNKWLLAGLAVGLGLHNHIIFLPTIVGIAAGGVVYWVGSFPFRRLVEKGQDDQSRPLLVLRRLFSIWPGLVGFAAGFGTQFVVLLLFREDQGDPGAVAEAFSDRLRALPSVLPLVVSGSSYVARYTGGEFGAWLIWAMTGILALLAASAFVRFCHKKAVWAWATGCVVHLLALLYVIDRFTLRYFVVFVLSVWVLAGVGLGTIFDVPNFAQGLRGARQLSIFKSEQLRASGAVLVSLVLSAWFGVVVLVPFLRTGGSTADFSLGNRTDNAAALVDVRPLIACLRGAGPVTSENVHIWNRLQYVSNEVKDLDIVSGENTEYAQWLVFYRLAGESSGELCPELQHFRVIARIKS